MLMRTGLYFVLRRSCARIFRGISTEALHYAERVLHVENLPVGYNVSTILDTIKAGTQIEKIRPQKTRISVYFYDQNCASRCLKANGGSPLSLKVAYAEGRIPSSVVASLGRYHASRILTIDHVPREFDVQDLKKPVRDRMESFDYDEAKAQLEISFLDTSTAFNIRNVLHENWKFEKSLFDYIHDDKHSFFPDWYRTEENDAVGPLKRSVELRCITSPTTAETCQAWTNRFDELSPTLVSASLVPKREIMYLAFATEAGADQFVKMFQIKSAKTGVEMELLARDHTIHPSLITALSLGASRSLVFTLNQEQYQILQKKDCRRLFSKMGRTSRVSVQFPPEALKGELIVQFDHIFSAMGAIHRLMVPGVLPDLKGSHVNFRGAHQLKYLVVQ
ncbi:uncharacterized protein BT62DRAFT_1081636 [Guyanagaster necrorhizus]|uniref:Uncharacterized protein n=1 Tax=Guyanagaster necrorhizus TaxID=856835 RepID=A0A9P7VFC2_9AGAR|nr:uncharacterized protein BT62DRAFT_1081636 [Guyanagaster necrorhizus MCA 3950]KAG7439365.1 hypothetical protein BT62DRAFT_1081636 [Guyanagaster necrorhizus MCA 3950]